MNAFPSGASVAPTYMSRYAPSMAGGRRGGGKISPTSSIISGFNPRDAPLDMPMGGGSGILPVITAQRDRFKKRNAELEHELSDTHRAVSQLRQEIGALQKDNLNLYEKSRYVSSYNRSSAVAGGAATSSSSYATNPNPSTVAIGGGGDVDGKYRSAYESNLSPFAAFRGRESARAYKRMSLPERVVYTVTRMVLATRTSRNLFALYLFALHLLVFFSVFSAGSSSADLHATEFGQSAAAVAAAAGGSGHGNWKEGGLNDKR